MTRPSHAAVGDERTIGDAQRSSLVVRALKAASRRVPWNESRRYGRYKGLRPAAYPTGRAVVFLASPASASRSAVLSLSKALELPTRQAKIENGLGHSLISSSYARVRRPHILYGHFLPTPRNVAIVSQVRRGPCLLSYRNVYDWAVSMGEKKARNGRSAIGLPFDRDLGSDGGLGTTDTHRAAGVRFVVRYELPWLIRFLNGWLAAAEAGDVDLVPVEFSRLISGDGIAEYVSTLPSDARPAGVSVPQPPTIGLNVGATGRGHQLLATQEIAAIDALVGDIPARRRALLPGFQDTPS